MHWNEACCRALGNEPDRAFQALTAAIDAALTQQEELDGEADFSTLKTLPGWAALQKRVQQKLEAHEKTFTQPKLRRELLTRMAADQAARNAMPATGYSEGALLEKLQAVDRENTTWMKQVVTRHGWPTWAMVGVDGAKAAWLLVQHADHDVPFQKLCLPKMTAAVKQKQASGNDLAYLVDRVAVAEHRKQTYGTQFINGVPHPIEDEAHVDERRKAMGLGTMAEYKQMMPEASGSPPGSAPDAGAP